MSGAERAWRRTAAAAAVALGIVGGLAAIVRWHYAPVEPRVVCVMPLGNGGHLVHWGYLNRSGEVLRADDIGGSSLINGDFTEIVNVNIIHQFEGGAIGSARDPAWVAAAKPGERLGWRVGGRTAWADSEAVVCPVVDAGVAVADAVILPQPAVEEAPQPVVEEAPEPAPDQPVAPPEPARAQATPRTTAARAKAPVVQTAKPASAAAEPVALQLEGLGAVQEGGMAVPSGAETQLGTPGEAGGGRAQPGGVREGGEPGGGGAPGGGTVGKRVAARVRVRPEGAWPEDAPPRAGQVVVRLSLEVGVDGRVRTVKIVRGAGAAFDRAARAVGLRAVFEPATLDGEAVVSWVPWDVVFTPDGF